MRKLMISSQELREMIAKRLGREACDVTENSKDDGFMSTLFDCVHDSVPLYIPLVRFLSAIYDVEEASVKLFWDSYNWTYSAEVTVNA